MKSKISNLLQLFSLSQSVRTNIDWLCLATKGMGLTLLTSYRLFVIGQLYWDMCIIKLVSISLIVALISIIRWSGSLFWQVPSDRWHCILVLTVDLCNHSHLVSLNFKYNWTSVVNLTQLLFWQLTLNLIFRFTVGTEWLRKGVLKQILTRNVLDKI